MEKITKVKKEREVGAESSERLSENKDLRGIQAMKGKAGARADK